MVHGPKCDPIIFSTLINDGPVWCDIEKILLEILYGNREFENDRIQKLLSLFVEYQQHHSNVTEKCLEKVVFVNQCCEDLYSCEMLRPETVESLLRTRQKCETITQLAEVTFQSVAIGSQWLLEIELRWKTSHSGLLTQLKRVYLKDYIRSINIVVD